MPPSHIPFRWKGKHAQVLCSSCHKGEAKPEFKCSNCHEPPQATHFGDDCERCHTPAGFDQATMADFPAPGCPGRQACHTRVHRLPCRRQGADLQVLRVSRAPRQTHFGPECETCHTPEGFQGAVLPPELHPVPLVGAHQRATCDVCHAEGQRVPEYVCSNCHKPPENHFRPNVRHLPHAGRLGPIGLRSSTGGAQNPAHYAGCHG